MGKRKSIALSTTKEKMEMLRLTKDIFDVLNALSYLANQEEE